MHISVTYIMLDSTSLYLMGHGHWKDKVYLLPQFIFEEILLGIYYTIVYLLELTEYLIN